MRRDVLITSLVITLVIIAGLVFTLKVYLSNHEQISPAKSALEPSQIESNFSYRDLQGEPISLKDHQDHIRVVHSFASWSPFSPAQLKLLSEVSQDMSDADVVFLAINRKEVPARVEQFLRSYGPFPGVEIILDDQDYFFSTTGGFAVPETIIYSASGDVLKHWRGEVKKADLQSVLEELLDLNQGS